MGYFWHEALGWPLVWDQNRETAIRSPHGGPKITWGGTPPEPRPGRNRLRFHLAASVNVALLTEMDRLISRGAARVETGHADATCVVMADPDGNEFWLSAAAEESGDR